MCSSSFYCSFLVTVALFFILLFFPVSLTTFHVVPALGNFFCFCASVFLPQLVLQHPRYNCCLLTYLFNLLYLSSLVYHRLLFYSIIFLGFLHWLLPFHLFFSFYSCYYCYYFFIAWCFPTLRLLPHQHFSSTFLPPSHYSPPSPKLGYLSYFPASLTCWPS